MSGDFGSMHGFGGGLWMALVWLIPIILATWAVKHVSGGASSNGASKSALELLDEQYARGKISREDYLQKRDDLMRSDSSAA